MSRHEKLPLDELVALVDGSWLPYESPRDPRRTQAEWNVVTLNSEISRRGDEGGAALLRDVLKALWERTEHQPADGKLSTASVTRTISRWAAKTTRRLHPDPTTRDGRDARMSAASVIGRQAHWMFEGLGSCANTPALIDRAVTGFQATKLATSLLDEIPVKSPAVPGHMVMSLRRILNEDLDSFANTLWRGAEAIDRAFGSLSSHSVKASLAPELDGYGVKDLRVTLPPVVR
jgi:hypothetical protein